MLLDIVVANSDLPARGYSQNQVQTGEAHAHVWIALRSFQAFHTGLKRVNTSIMDEFWSCASGSISESDESITSAARKSIVCLSTQVVNPRAPLAPANAASLSKKALNHLNL
jgi:hypothetical protein